MTLCFLGTLYTWTGQARVGQNNLQFTKLKKSEGVQVGLQRKECDVP